MNYKANYDAKITFKATKGQRDFLKRYGKLYGLNLTETIQAILNQDYTKIMSHGFSASALGKLHDQISRDEEMSSDYDPLEHFDYLTNPGDGYVPEERPISDWEFQNLIMWHEYFKDEAEKEGEEYDEIDPREDPHILSRLDRNMQYHNY